ncbi:hypothetical protein [Paraburkholderia sp. J41]|uniref:hypothetical protein n=1 Tax=Paraburkholderia sp. J41 TaxID=2805433 RepID=UPI002AC32B73|nr:hypothetical protein [Paraburkholderia sp. J41]
MYVDVFIHALFLDTPRPVAAPAIVTKTRRVIDVSKCMHLGRPVAKKSKSSNFFTANVDINHARHYAIPRASKKPTASNRWRNKARSIARTHGRESHSPSAANSFAYLSNGARRFDSMQ